MTHGKSSLVLDRQVIYGLLFLGLIASLLVGTVCVYQGVFRQTVEVTATSDRAGLTLTSGAPVKLRGVAIGRVDRVTTDGDEVKIVLALDKDKAGLVPADISAQIVPPTAFGAKYVQLTPRAGSGVEASIEAGAVIPADRVTVEVDEAFENLSKVLEVARPAEVNSALTAVAGAVDARGELIGNLISQTDAYLRSFNPSLRTLAADLRVADDVAEVYDVARPDLVATFSQTGVVSQTLVRQKASLRALEQSLIGFSDEADTLLRNSQQGLTTSLRLLAPVSKVLSRYSPELPCVILGLASANKLAEDAVGGTNPGITTITRVIPAREPYKFEKNLPQLGDDRAPACYGLPYVTPAEGAVPPPAFSAGANPYVGPQPAPDQAALETILGLIDGGLQLP